MKVVLVATLLSALIIVISEGLSLKPSPRREITFPRPLHSNNVGGGMEVEKNQTVESMEETEQSDEGENEAQPARLRVSNSRRKKVEQETMRENRKVTKSRSSSKERKLHTKVVTVPYVVQVEKHVPIYIEKKIIVEKAVPIKLTITKKESKHR